jgi:hypothetical protein
VALVARSDVRGAVDAMKAGACDCQEKPVAADRFREAIRAQLDQVAASTASLDEKGFFRTFSKGASALRHLSSLTGCKIRLVETAKVAVHEMLGNILRKWRFQTDVNLAENWPAMSPVRAKKWVTKWVSRHVVATCH